MLIRYVKSWGVTRVSGVLRGAIVGRGIGRVVGGRCIFARIWMVVVGGCRDDMGGRLCVVHLAHNVVPPVAITSTCNAPAHTAEYEQGDQNPCIPDSTSTQTAEVIIETAAKGAIPKCIVVSDTVVISWHL